MIKVLERVCACDYCFEWKPQDLWIGAFWKTTPGAQYHRFDLWICVVPMFPLHITRRYHAQRKDKN